MRTIGMPHRPKPPTARLAPSGMSATASAADPTILSRPRLDRPGTQVIGRSNRRRSSMSNL